MSETLETLLKCVLIKRRFSLGRLARPRNFSFISFNNKTRNQIFKKWMGVDDSQENHLRKSSSKIVSSPLGEMTIPNITFFDLIFENIKLWERKTAVECGLTGRKYTYKELMSHSKALAASFQNKFKLVKGNFMAVILSNCPEYPIVLLAASLCGVISSTVNPTYTIDEILKQMREFDAKLIIADHGYYEKCEAVVKTLGAQIPIVVLKTSSDPPGLKGGIDLLELFDQSSSGTLKPVNVEPEDPFILPYSSGTSGGPKGVLLSHRNVISNLVQIRHPGTLFMNPTTRFHQDKVFGVLPMFHIYGITVITFYPLKEGCRLILLPRFNPRLYITNIIRKRVNILFAVPPIIAFLGDKAVRSKYLKSVNFVVNAASPLIINDALTLIEKAQHLKVIQGYGMTECSPVLTHTSAERMQKLTSVGIPIASTKLKISHPETGEQLPKGEVGELCALGPQVMKGYYNRPQETKDIFDSEGWLRTGDMAYYDDEGDFFIVERLKDIMKIKGFQVAPAEVEEVIRIHPGVKEVAVIGVSHKEFGEVPKAFVVLKEGAQVTQEDIKEIVKQKLSSYKQLRGGVKFVDELPKNNTGKVLRKALKNL